MTDRPIIFSGPMVRALLDGTKTQTRRLASSPQRRCEVGDRLYVREAFSLELAGGGSTGGKGEWAYELEYRLDSETREILFSGDHADDPYSTLADRQIGDWRPSIHMPRWASRLTLIVETVRVEPLQAISRSDAIAEGLSLASAVIEEFWRWPEPYHAGHWLSPPAAYRWLWNELHGAGSWETNPDVLALTFRVERRNIDAGAHP